jgi:hypothetical protein
MPQSTETPLQGRGGEENRATDGAFRRFRQA